MTYQFVREPLLAEEADLMANACETFEEKLIIWTLLDTGLRVNELCSLTIANILWQERCLRITGKGGIYGKMSKKRVVPVSKRVMALFENYFANHNEWFVKKRMAQLIVKRVANRARILKPVTAHVLRHTFATIALQKGISLAALQKIMGHDRIATTQIYLNLTDVHLADEFHRKW